MRSCLEIVSMDERHEELVRNDYSPTNKYDENHEDAKATGDRNGKGVGGSHSHWLPNCNGQLNVIDYSNFRTRIEDGAGNVDDVAARQESLARSMYNYQYFYDANLVDTSMNVAEGQYVTY